jgi:hypothetical protein
VDGNDRELTMLSDAADSAYERVRFEIVARIPPPSVIDVSRLKAHQKDALDELCRTESALAAYRKRMYV